MLLINKVISILITLLFLSSQYTYSQEKISLIPNKNKGQFYFYWGWNQSEYTRSDISFRGENYAFTLENVKATDRQSKFSSIYFNPVTATIPQYNVRIGYFLTEQFSISIGNDHMKYVVTQNQKVEINGEIYGSGTLHDAYYENDEVTLTEDFLTFEHTDGLNYENIELRYHYDWLNSKGFSFNIIEGIGAGIMLPKTNSKLLGNERNDEFRLAGYGINAIFALNVKHKSGFFIQSEAKGGYTNMPDIRTSKFLSDKAKQDFFFFQYNVVVGFQFGRIRQ